MRRTLIAAGASAAVVALAIAIPAIAHQHSAPKVSVAPGVETIGQPQVFGTQYNNHDDSPYTQAAYNRDLVPDQLRALFCVPDTEQQRKNVAAFNVDKYPEGIIPPGCSR